MVWADRLASLSDSEFRIMYRITKEGFADLVMKLEEEGSLLSARSDGLSIELQLSIAIRWLAGGQYVDIGDLHQVNAKSTVYVVLWRTLAAIDKAVLLPFNSVESLHDTEMLDHLATSFSRSSGGIIQGCVSAVDGIHMRIEKPSMGGESWFSRKGCYSVNCQAACDSERRFTWANAQSKGPSHDSTCWMVTSLAKAIEEGHLPEQYFIVGDDVSS